MGPRLRLLLIYRLDPGKIVGGCARNLDYSEADLGQSASRSRLLAGLILWRRLASSGE